AADLADDLLERLAALTRAGRNVVERVHSLDGLPERPPLGERVQREALDARVAYPARRIIDDAPQADLVGAIERELQVREQVLHLFALEERLPAHHTMRHRLLAQRLLHRLGLAVRPIEDGDVLRLTLLVANEPLDLARHPLGLDLRAARAARLPLASAELRPDGPL